ncbi:MULTISPECIES: DUF998 domain-containing protein [Streptosporangium]|uniref:DUF998 domain-containing protein n=1 Tax=Streptosporangium brasiliense TaxID=47480 RepID=A0ABT9REF8_9ACTN|nr:DUF998 domain-containing protein [Streptosporangium brasiliense]MDP9867657.1 hypothetical protein [Streptosporangium brasiliense]
MRGTLLAAPPPAGGPSRPDHAHATTRRLLACGAVAGPLFVAAFLVEGATRAGYDPLRHPVSSLALGDSGWTQSAAFIVTGLLTLAFAAGLRRVLRGAEGPARGSVWGPALIGVWAVQLIGAGIFTTDPVSGYPPGTPDRLVEYGSAHAAVHDLIALPGFAALAAACVVFALRSAARRERAWAIYSAASAVAFVGAFILATVAFEQAAGLVELGGLFQRVAVTVGLGWLTLLAVRARRAHSVSRRSGPREY